MRLHLLHIILNSLQPLRSLSYSDNYSKRWRFEASVKKCAVAIFSKVGKALGGWVWGGESLPVLGSYCYLRIEFSSDGSWDKHINSLVLRNRQNLVVFTEFDIILPYI